MRILSENNESIPDAQQADYFIPFLCIQPIDEYRSNRNYHSKQAQEGSQNFCFFFLRILAKELGWGRGGGGG